MGWAVEPDLLKELQDKCVGFATGVHFASLPGICSSGALLSNAQLPKGTLRPSQAHDSNKTSKGHDSIYFRFVQRSRNINRNYKRLIVNSLCSVGFSSGLLFYMDFNEAYNHLALDFANPMDCIGGLANTDTTKQFQSIIAKLDHSPELAEIAFHAKVPFSCVKYIGVNFGPKGASRCPPYLSSHRYTEWSSLIPADQADPAAAQIAGSTTGLYKPNRRQWISLISRLFQHYNHPFVALNDMVPSRSGDDWQLFLNTAYADAPPNKILFFPPLAAPPAQPARPSQPRVAATPTTVQSHLPPLRRPVRRH